MHERWAVILTASRHDISIDNWSRLMKNKWSAPKNHFCYNEVHRFTTPYNSTYYMFMLKFALDIQEKLSYANYYVT